MKDDCKQQISFKQQQIVRKERKTLEGLQRGSTGTVDREVFVTCTSYPSGAAKTRRVTRSLGPVETIILMGTFRSKQTLLTLSINK